MEREASVCGAVARGERGMAAGVSDTPASAARPTEIVTSSAAAPARIENGSPAMRRRMRSATIAATAMSVSGMTMTNSSPP